MLLFGSEHFHCAARNTGAFKLCVLMVTHDAFIALFWLPRNAAAELQGRRRAMAWSLALRCRVYSFCLRWKWEHTTNALLSKQALSCVFLAVIYACYWLYKIYHDCGAFIYLFPFFVIVGFFFFASPRNWQDSVALFFIFVVVASKLPPIVFSLYPLQWPTLSFFK